MPGPPASRRTGATSRSASSATKPSARRRWPPAPSASASCRFTPRRQKMESAKTLPDARVDAHWIASHIDDPSVKFVEIDVSASAYNAGHIPGAALWNAYTDLRHSDYRPISAAELQEVLRRSGVTPDTTVVFY